MNMWYTYVNIRSSENISMRHQADIAGRLTPVLWRKSGAGGQQLLIISGGHITCYARGLRIACCRRRRTWRVMRLSRDDSSREAFGGLRRHQKPGRTPSSVAKKTTKNKSLQSKKRQLASHHKQKQRRRQKDRDREERERERKRPSEMKTPEIPGMFRYIYICFIACKYTFI